MLDHFNQSEKTLFSPKIDHFTPMTLLPLLTLVSIAKASIYWKDLCPGSLLEKWIQDNPIIEKNIINISPLVIPEEDTGSLNIREFYRQVVSESQGGNSLSYTIATVKFIVCNRVYYKADSNETKDSEIPIRDITPENHKQYFDRCSSNLSTYIFLLIFIYINWKILYPCFQEKLFHE